MSLTNAKTYTLSCEQFAALNKVRPNTVRSRICREGSYFGVIPQKLANGRLAFPAELGKKQNTVKTQLSGQQIMETSQKSRLETLTDFLETRTIYDDATLPYPWDDLTPEGDDRLPMTAPDILISGADAIAERAEARDTPAGERVMRRSVAMFNAWRSGDSIHQVTEAEGWIFLALVKLCRANAGGHNLDDYIDGAAYIALAGEHADQLDESAY